MPRKEADKIAIGVRNKLIQKNAIETALKYGKFPTKLEILKAKYPKFSKRNDDLARQASAAAQNSNRRLQNWVSAKVKCQKVSLGDYETINAGRYKGKYNRIIWNYAPLYTSYYRIGPGGRKIIYTYGFDKPERRVVSAPKGMIFERDDNGLMLRRLSDNMDFHPSTKDLLAKNFVTLVRKNMAENYSARMSQRRNEKLAKFKAEQDKKRADWLESVFKQDLSNTMVTLNDSCKAGNYIEGSLQFAERRLGISRQEILNGGHLFHVCAKRLVKTGDKRAIRAVKVAWERETTVCI